MNKKLAFFLVYMVVTTPLGLLANYALHDNTLSLPRIAGCVLSSISIFAVINWVSALQNKKVVGK